MVGIFGSDVKIKTLFIGAGSLDLCIMNTILKRKGVLAVFFALILIIFTGLDLSSGTFASLRTVENMANGAGMLFNPGVHEVSLTSPLYFAVLLTGVLSGMDPAIFASFQGVAFFLLAILLIGGIENRDESPASLFAVFLLLTIPPVLYHAADGSSFGLSLFLAAFLIRVLSIESGPKTVSLTTGITGGLLYLTNPAFILFALAPGLYVWIYNSTAASSSGEGQAPEKASYQYTALHFAAFLMLAAPVELFFVSYYGSSYLLDGSGVALQTLLHEEALNRFLSWRFAFSPGFIFAVLLLATTGISSLRKKRSSTPNRDKNSQNRSYHILFLTMLVAAGLTLVLWTMGFQRVSNPITPVSLVAILTILSGILVGEFRRNTSTKIELMVLGILIASSLPAFLWKPEYKKQPPVVYPEGINPDTVAAGEEPPVVSHLWKNFSRCTDNRPFPVAVTGRCAIQLKSSLPGQFAYEAKADLLVLDEKLRIAHSPASPDLVLSPVFCPTGNTIYDSLMLTQGGVLHTLDVEWLAIHPDPEGLIRSLIEMKKNSNPALLFLEQKENRSVLQVIDEMKEVMNDPYFKEKRSCWDILKQPSI